MKGIFFLFFFLSFAAEGNFNLLMQHHIAEAANHGRRVTSFQYQSSVYTLMPLWELTRERQYEAYEMVRLYAEQMAVREILKRKDLATDFLSFLKEGDESDLAEKAKKLAIALNERALFEHLSGREHVDNVVWINTILNELKILRIEQEDILARYHELREEVTEYMGFEFPGVENLVPSAYIFYIGGKLPLRSLRRALWLKKALPILRFLGSATIVLKIRPWMVTETNLLSGETREFWYPEWASFIYGTTDLGSSPKLPNPNLNMRFGAGVLFGEIIALNDLAGPYGAASVHWNSSSRFLTPQILRRGNLKVGILGNNTLQNFFGRGEITNLFIQMGPQVGAFSSLKGWNTHLNFGWIFTLKEGADLIPAEMSLREAVEEIFKE